MESSSGAERARPRAGEPDGALGMISIVIPILDEREALPDLISEVDEVLERIGRPSELIVVDDGSTDGSYAYLAELAAERDDMTVVRLRRNFGKSAALSAGFDRSVGEVVVTIDGDGQDDPAEIPSLIAKLDEGYDVVSGWKRDRRDPAVRRWASRLFNWVTARLSRVQLHDLNCGLKAYRGECVRSLRIYGELHRFIPVLAVQRGWTATEVPVNHRPREHGRSKFGLERYGRGLLDLVTVLFIGRYENRPLHLFGGFGIALMLAGLAIAVYLTILKLAGESIGDRPLLLLGVLLIVVGIQFLTFGLLGQMLVAMRQQRGYEESMVAPPSAGARSTDSTARSGPVRDTADDRQRVAP
jgi:glycosyltransferase involved in cell wall biosynthesis